MILILLNLICPLSYIATQFYYLCNGLQEWQAVNLKSLFAWIKQSSNLMKGNWHQEKRSIWNKPECHNLILTLLNLICPLSYIATQLYYLCNGLQEWLTVNLKSLFAGIKQTSNLMKGDWRWEKRSKRTNPNAIISYLSYLTWYVL